ncbi:hypothetical protein BK120_22830 [Paenibacillus sp. FSL A5-0031]|uniref:hypothetical protein n=1 Tax=Paenibacillus sp. FSL A5-0031 TaxID=1920420 RepID=UPI00096C8799|nr:hypothetical protein [Paenibacillus sp. FSL A5-0031]OME78577.1 hypothetical protein BK120_22830 [Paenibacillus sp. FSL A5-0031]
MEDVSFIVHCKDCGMPEWHGNEESDMVSSHCKCEDKRVKCDCCEHSFLPKDMSLHCMYLSLCKICNDLESNVMDNMAIAIIKANTSHAFSMLCVEIFGDKLQLTMRSYHMGLSVIFPAMTKKEIVGKWMELPLGYTTEVTDQLYNSAFLRLKPDYLLDEEIVRYKKDWIDSKRSTFST